MKKEIIYRYSDVVIEKEWGPRQVQLEFNHYRLVENFSQNKIIGKAFNVRFERINKLWVLICDIKSTKDLKGMYPSISVQILAKDGNNIKDSMLINVSAGSKLNVDETLEPFI